MRCGRPLENVFLATLHLFGQPYYLLKSLNLASCASVPYASSITRMGMSGDVAFIRL